MRKNRITSVVSHEQKKWRQCISALVGQGDSLGKISLQAAQFLLHAEIECDTSISDQFKEEHSNLVELAKTMASKELNDTLFNLLMTSKKVKFLLKLKVRGGMGSLWRQYTERHRIELEPAVIFWMFENLGKETAEVWSKLDIEKYPVVEGDPDFPFAFSLLKTLVLDSTPEKELNSAQIEFSMCFIKKYFQGYINEKAKDYLAENFIKKLKKYIKHYENCNRRKALCQKIKSWMDGTQVVFQSTVYLDVRNTEVKRSDPAMVRKVPVEETFESIGAVKFTKPSQPIKRLVEILPEEGSLPRLSC